MNVAITFIVLPTSAAFTTFKKTYYNDLAKEDTTDATNNGSATSKAAVKAVRQVCKSSVDWSAESTSYFASYGSSCPSTYGNDRHYCSDSSDIGNKYMTDCNVNYPVSAFIYEATGSYATNTGTEYSWPSDSYFSCTITPDTTGQRYRVGGATKAYTTYEESLVYTSSGLSSCTESTDKSCNSSREGADIDYCSYNSSTGKWTKTHKVCKYVQYWRWDENVCLKYTKVFVYYNYCGATYKYVDDKTNYPDTYPDTCTETTPACSSSSNVGNIKVTCVND